MHASHLQYPLMAAQRHVFLGKSRACTKSSSFLILFAILRSLMVNLLALKHGNLLILSIQSWTSLCTLRWNSCPAVLPLLLFVFAICLGVSGWEAMHVDLSSAGRFLSNPVGYCKQRGRLYVGKLSPDMQRLRSVSNATVLGNSPLCNWSSDNLVPK